MTARRTSKHGERRKDRPSTKVVAAKLASPKALGASPDAIAPGWHKLIPLIIVFAALAVYTNSLNNEFLFDDKPFIVKNENIRQLTNAFSRNSRQEARPLVYFSLAMNYALGRLDTTGYHLFNLLIHILAAWTLFGVVRRTLLSPRLETRFKESSTPLAFVVALLWTVHPLQTECVSYVFQRSESMMALSYLLSLYCLIRGAKQEGSRRGLWYTGVIVFAGLGMSCKAVVITLPAVLWLYDRIFLCNSLAQTLRKRWPVYIGTVLIMALVGIALSDIHHMAASQISPRAAGDVNFRIGRADNLVEYVRSQPTVILHYLKLAFWPQDLCLDYKMEPIQGTWQIAITTAALLVLLVSTGLLLLRFPAIGFPAAFLFIVLAPTALYWRLELVFEHRMYLPLAGLVSFTVLVCHHLLLRMADRFRLSRRALNRAALTLLLLVTCALGLRTIVRNRDYKNPLSMYRSAVEVRPENPRAQVNLANHLKDQFDTLRHEGHAEEARAALAEAVACYEAAVRLSPTYLPARINLSNAYLSADRLDDAIEQLRRIVELKPNHKTALYNLAYNLKNRAMRVDKSGDRTRATADLEESLVYYRRSRKERPDHKPSRIGLGDVLYKLRRYDEAIPVLRQCVKDTPQDLNVLRLLSDTLYRAGKRGEAKETVQALLKRAPSDKWGRALLGKMQ